MRKKAIFMLAMILALAVSVSGCSKSSLDGSQTIAVLDDTAELTLGEFNLMFRYQQAQMETYYAGLFGSSNIYQQDLSGDGQLYGDTVKDTLMDEFEELMVLEAEAPNYGVELTEEEKAAVAAAAEQFLADNDEGTIKAIGADQAMVEHVLELMTIQTKMYSALSADVDTEVSDEEAAQKRISYIYVSLAGTETDEDGNTVDLTDEEKAEKKAALQSVLDEAKETGDLDAAAEAQDLTVVSTTYGEENSTVAEAVKEAADTLGEGEYSEIVEGNSAYYLIRMDSLLDREATDSYKGTIIEQRKSDLYTEKCEELKEAHTFTTVDSAMAELTYERNYVLKTAE